MTLQPPSLGRSPTFNAFCSFSTLDVAAKPSHANRHGGRARTRCNRNASIRVVRSLCRATSICALAGAEIEVGRRGELKAAAKGSRD